MTGALAHINRKRKYRVQPGTASGAAGRTDPPRTSPSPMSPPDVDQTRPGSTPGTSAPRPVRGEETLVHLALVCRKCSQDLALLAFWHLDEVECPAKLRRDLIELLGRNPEFAMRFFQAQGCAPGSRGCKLERSARNVADPSGAHEFETRQPAQILRVPIAEGGLCRTLTNDRVLDDGIAEMVDDCCDRECATEPFVQA
jgi:hypothetical protein